MTLAVPEWAGSGRKSAGAGPGPAPAPALFLPDPAHSETADVMKSMMYFDSPLHILTSIHLHILPSSYLAYEAIKSDVVSHPNWLWLLAVANLGCDKNSQPYQGMSRPPWCSKTTSPRGKINMALFEKCCCSHGSA